jgi:O-antigen/teichoic acid export membrane protein
MAYVAMQMLLGIVVLRWISPADMGLWNVASILAPYVSVLQLGIFVALNRELPFLLGKNEREKAINHVKTAANHANRVSLVLLSITVVSLGYLYFEAGNEKFLWVAASFGASVLLQTQQNFLVVTFRSANDFQRLGLIYLAIIPVYLLSVSLVYGYGFYGFLVFQVVTPLVLVSLLYKFRPYPVRPQFIRESFKDLLATGIPFFSLNYIGGLAPTFKKIIILKYLGTGLLGLFSPALAILSVGRVLPRILGQFVYPRMSRRYGESKNRRHVWKINIRAILFTTLLAIPIVFSLNLILPYLFDYVFPEYREAIDATRIVLLSVMFIVPQMAYNSLASVKALRAMGVVVVLKLVIYWFVIVVTFSEIGGLEGIAWGIVVSDALFSITVLSICYYELVLKKTHLEKHECI